jgi:ANTAR domain
MIPQTVRYWASECAYTLRSRTDLLPSPTQLLPFTDGVTLTSRAHPGSPDDMEANAVSLAGVMSRETIQSAMDLLMQRYGLHDREQAFEIMRRVYQVGNVKLRTVAEHDDRVTVGQEAARLDRRRLLSQPAEVRNVAPSGRQRLRVWGAFDA